MNQESSTSPDGILILKLGAEGGSLRLMAKGGTEPRFSAFVHDQALTYIDEGPEIDHRSEWGSWEDGIGALDRYPWRQLFPRFVHPEYADRIWALLQSDWANVRESRREDWTMLCGRSSAQDAESVR